MVNLRKKVLEISRYVAWGARKSRLNISKFSTAAFFIEHLWWLVLESLATIVNDQVCGGLDYACNVFTFSIKVVFRYTPHSFTDTPFDPGNILL